MQAELGTDGAEQTAIDKDGIQAGSRLDISAAISSIEPHRLALQLAAAILVLGLLGGLEYLGARSVLGPFSLDNEFTVPAVFSSLLLLAAAALAVALAASEEGRLAAALWVLAAAFAFMGVDELAVIHENWDDWFGLENWILGYFPVAAVAAVAWLVLLRRIPSGLARRLWLAAPAAWIAAAVFELPTQLTEPDGDIPAYGLLLVSEELLEMVGSACFALTLLVLLQRWRAGASPDAG